MSFFVEGLQGSGKSTLVQKLSEKYKDYKVFHEGDYSPVELAWCAYLDKKQYEQILDRYSDIKDEIKAKTVAEGEHFIVCYTQIITDIPGFHKDLEQYEIYNSRKSFEEFENIVLTRFKNWKGEKQIFECSVFQNIVEDLILFTLATDEDIIGFYKKVKAALAGNAYKIIYLETEDVRSSIEVIKKERSDEQGNELWFPMMVEYFNQSPYAQKNGLSGMDGLINHLEHRQSLEMRLCKEIFPEQAKVWKSKQYELN